MKICIFNPGTNKDPLSITYFENNPLKDVWNRASQDVLVPGEALVVEVGPNRELILHSPDNPQ